MGGVATHARNRLATFHLALEVSTDRRRRPDRPSEELLSSPPGLQTGARPAKFLAPDWNGPAESAKVFCPGRTGRRDLLRSLAPDTPGPHELSEFTGLGGPEIPRGIEMGEPHPMERDGP